MNIRIVVFDGADEFDFVGPYEAFRHAAMLGADVDAGLVTLEPQSQVVAAHGLRLIPEGVITGTPDLVLVPGGGWVNHAALGVRAQVARGNLPRKMAEFHAAGATIAGVCTGVMVLAAAGLLDGRVATTHSGAIKDLRSSKAHVIQSRVVDEGDILTCGGVTASLDLALWLIERDVGNQVAEAVATYMEHRRSRDVYIARDGI
jgi:transcriptional regulator GlxA family with amidase domain